MQKLRKVFDPIDIGSLTLKNRFIRMGAISGIPMDDKTESDVVSPRWLAHYEALAAGGVSERPG